MSSFTEAIGLSEVAKKLSADAINWWIYNAFRIYVG